MEHVYRFLLIKYGFGKIWVNMPVPRNYKDLPIHIRYICGCGRKPIPANWQIGTVIDDSAPYKMVNLEHDGSWNYRNRRQLILWSGACPDCDKVFFAMAARIRPLDRFEEWKHAQQTSKPN